MRLQVAALAALALLAGIAHTLLAWQQPPSDQTAEVEKLDRELSAAGVRGDVDATARLIADAAIFVTLSGKTITKADELASMKSPDFKQDSENIDEIHSKQFGDTVVLWGRVTSQGTYKQKPFHHTFNFTDVWQNHNGNWQQVFTRGTPVEEH